MKQQPKPRILIISTARTIGGGEIYLANILPLLRVKYDFTVLATPPVINLLQDIGTTTHRLALFPRIIEKFLKRSYQLKRTYYRLYFWNYLKKHHFDIINLQEFDGAFVDAIVFEPIVLTEQTRMIVPKNLIKPFKQLFKKVDRVVCVSQQTLNDVTGLGVPIEKCRVIHNGVDTKKFSPPKKPGEYISWIGRVEEEDKNPLLFLEIAAAAQSEGLSYKFRLIGEGSALPEMRAYAKDKGLTNIEIVGGKKPAEMIAIYGQSKLLCLTSKTEGLPFVILEAMACGVPVVSSRVGGIPEIINSPRVGSLVEELNKDKFLEEIKKLMEEEEFYRKTSLAARERIEQEFSINHQIEQMDEEYDRLINYG